MFFSRKKQKQPLESFCQSFYETILSPKVGSGNTDVLATFAQTDRKLIAAEDPRFSQIDIDRFKSETTNLRFELFSLAALHSFGTDIAVRVSLFTHDYLRDKSRSDVWDGMEPYNQQINRSILHLKKRMGASWERYVAENNKKRFDLFTKYLDKARTSGIDVEKNNFSNRIARPLNLLFIDKLWNDGTTARSLILPLCDRLGFDSEFLPNERARIWLSAIITGFYDGARQAMTDIEPV